MKTNCVVHTLVMLFFVFTATAQQGINYKAIINDAEGNVLASTLVLVQFTILENGTTNVFQDYHKPTTDANGIIIVNIGEGSVISGDFTTIDWASNPHFLKTEIDIGDGLTDMGTTELKTVPYALHAETVNGQQGAVENDLISYDGTNWVARNALLQDTGGGQSENNMQPWLGINHVIALEGLYPSRSGDMPFIAEIYMFGGNFAPRGYALCDGQILSISQYQALFSLLGTTFGGDGRTTFGLPDLRGRTAIHPGTGPGLRNRRLGEKGGSETNIMTIEQMPSHTHTITYQ